MNIEYKAPPLTPADDLFKELAEVTAPKPENFRIDDFTAEIPEQAPLKTKDFAPDPAPIREPEPPEQPLEPPINYKEQARLLISFTEGLQCLALPVAYQKSYFSDAEQETLKEIRRKFADPVETTLTEQEQELYERYQDVQELIDKLPFTDREVKTLENPLSAVMEKYKFTPGPETLLIGAIFAVMAPRLAPLLISFK